MQFFDGPCLSPIGEQFTEKVARALKPVFDELQFHGDVWQLELVAHDVAAAMVVLAHERIQAAAASPVLPPEKPTPAPKPLEY